MLCNIMQYVDSRLLLSHLIRRHIAVLSEEYKMNKYLLGIKDFFKGYIVYVWIRVDFSSNKYKKVNKKVGLESGEFYAEY